MKRFAGSTLLVLAFVLRAGAQATYVIGGTVSTPPVIDAVSIRNDSLNFNIGTTLPWDTSNTRNFTNNGYMNGSVGFRFDTAPRDSSGTPIAPRKLADNFVNLNSSYVNAQDSLLANGYYNGSYLLVQATNIISRGILQAGGAGLVEITGTNVNLARSGVGITPLTATGSQNRAPTTNQFRADVAIYDLYWGQTNMTVSTPGLATFDPYTGDLVRVTAPPHQVTRPGVANPGPAGFTLTDGIYGAYSNAVAPPLILSVTNSDGSRSSVTLFTNTVRQLVVVGYSDTNMQASIRFTPSTNPTNYMQTASVELLVPEFDAITGQSSVSSLYFVDTLASEVYRGLLTNSITGPTTIYPTATFRPANYLVSRLTPSEFAFGAPGNTQIDNNFLYQPEFTNRNVLAEYAGYSDRVDYLSSRPPPIPAGGPTNYPGRLTITADVLDLTRTRMRAEGLLTIQTRHLIGSSNAVADSSFLRYNLGSTNGNLVLQNLMAEEIARFRGTNSAWSARWSNSYPVLTDNYASNATTGNFELVPLTNFVTVNLHVLFLDADALVNLVPVSVYQLGLHATNVVVVDNGVVSQNFLVDGRSFTLQGRLRFTSPLVDWTWNVAPTLRYFTNTGTLIIPSVAHFGDDGPTNYLTFVNRGTISSQGQNINSDYCELNGINSAGAFTVFTRDGKVESGQVSASVSVAFTANTLKFNNATVDSSGLLALTVTNALYDNGGGSGNVISFGDGCTLYRKPASGDLLGTTFVSQAPVFAQVDHFWAGEDRGPTRAGYSNNVAVGRLTLSPDGVDPYFYFSGTSVSNGWYVDVLDLSELDDFANQMEINQNLVIYYAAAKLGFTPPGGQTPEEYLDGQFGGHLRWVQDFTGPGSTVDVVINGNQTIQVNKAFRNSTTIDSDADGVTNFSDLSPFDGVQVTSIQSIASPAGYRLTWPAAAGTTYRVEYRTNLTGAAWQYLLTTTYSATTNGFWSAEDTTAGVGAGQRYYRVLYSPIAP